MKVVTDKVIATRLALDTDYLNRWMHIYAVNHASY